MTQNLTQTLNEIAALISIDEIEVTDRARSDNEDTTAIEESAKSFMGQIQSIAVERTPDGPKPYRLLAGGRRVFSFAKVGMNQVLCRVYPPLTESQRKEIELTENTARLDMSWQDRARLTEQIHQAQLALKGHKIDRNSPEGWSMKDTAKFMGVSGTTVSQDLLLARLMKDVPQIADCKKQKDAMKLVANIVESAAKVELGKRMQQDIKEKGGNEWKRKLVEGYQVGDFFERIKLVPSESINFIDLDPPYAIAYDEYGDYKSTTSPVLEAEKRKEFKEFSEKDYMTLLPIILNECYRVLKRDSWLVCWFGTDPWAEYTYSQLLKAGFQLKRLPGIWNKNVDRKDSCPSSAPDLYLGRTYETFYYARKGSPIINRRGRADVFNYPREYKNRIHPTEKPVPLMKDIISTFTLPGSTILVPFLGSGNTLLAAAACSCLAFGFDLSEENKQKFLSRVAEIKEEPK